MVGFQRVKRCCNTTVWKHTPWKSTFANNVDFSEIPEEGAEDIGIPLNIFSVFSSFCFGFIDYRLVSYSDVQPPGLTFVDLPTCFGLALFLPRPINTHILKDTTVFSIRLKPLAESRLRTSI